MAVMRESHKSVYWQGHDADRDAVPEFPNASHNASTAPDGGWTGFDAHDEELGALKKGSLGKSEFAGYKGLGVRK